MVDHARLAFGARRLAVHAGIGGTAGGKAEREVVADQRNQSAPAELTVIAAKARRESSRPVQELKRVYRRRPLADLEMELRRTDLARLTGFGNDLAALDGIAALHQQFTGMGIGGGITVGVPNQKEGSLSL